ncbi:transglycosylase domain-containing protein [bacterium]|nr:transglycosylase domain-containing protein [bacterium]
MNYNFGVSNNSRKTYENNKNRRLAVGGSVRVADLGSYRTMKQYSSAVAHTKGKNDPKIVKSKKKKKNKTLKKILLIFFGMCFFLGCGVLVALGIYLKQIQNSLPSPDELISRSSDESTQILDRNGNILYTIYGDENREFVSINDIPDYTKWAVLAAEDVEFYQHKGIDYISIARAFIQNLMHKSVVSGASTITQQLVRNTLLFDMLGDEAYEQTYARKIKEVLITMQVEQTFTKDEILQMYLNEIPLGGVNYGIQAAAKAYFGKDARDLDLSESALIAGLIQAPGSYSPLYGSEPEMAKIRQEYVLGQMEKHMDLTGVTVEDVAAAKDEELVYSSAKIDISAPHFVLYVKQLLIDKYGADRVERGGLKVTTSLDSTLQAIAEEEVVSGVERNAHLNVNNGAMIVINPKNGQILAMVGSKDYWNIDDPRVDGNVNITTSERQMGSSVKPFVYLNAFQSANTGPWLLTPDINEISFGNYKPRDWDGKYMGLMTARYALGLSRNVPAVYALQLGGISNYVQLMQKLGVDITNKESYGLSIALGSAEMKLVEFANAYAALANGGVQYPLTSVLKITNSSGEVIYEVEESEGTRVIDEKEAYLVNWMACDLQGYNDKSENSYFYVNGHKMCGKTGTTDGPKDLVGVLYNQSIVVISWNGNNNNEEMPNAWASGTALTVSNSFMKRVIDSYNEFSFNRPAGVQTTRVCLDTGTAASDTTKCSKTEVSVCITGACPQDDTREEIEVCKDSKLVSTNLEAAQHYDLTTKAVLIKNKLENQYQQEAYEKYMTSLENSPYIFSMPESGECKLPLGENNAPVIDLASPSSGGNYKPGDKVNISGSVRYLDGISSFTVTANGKDITTKSTFNSKTNKFSVDYTIPANYSKKTLEISVKAVDVHNIMDLENVIVNVQVATQTEEEKNTIDIYTTTEGTNMSITAAVHGPDGTNKVTISVVDNDDSTKNATLSATDKGGGEWITTYSGVNGHSYSITAQAYNGNKMLATKTITASIAASTPTE